jgi:anaerobic ribonucleoside-triphosphate reductase
MCDAKVIKICRVTGYLRPAHLYNVGKQMEHAERKCYNINTYKKS